MLCQSFEGSEPPGLIRLFSPASSPATSFFFSASGIRPKRKVLWDMPTDRQPHYVDLTQITRTCQDMVYSVDIGLKKPDWLRGRYLLVRYEDLALNPEAKAKEIYKFLDLDIDNKVLTWISQNTNVTSSTSSKYSTSRDSKTTPESWRLNLGFDIVKTVQTLCNDTLALLGYKIVQSEVELRKRLRK
uniref:Sulfotransferase n=1 Tax=Pangasius sp. VGB-2018 TaxID=2161644 RepID=A0A2R4LVI4_9TELE|nr:peroxisome proliferator-activated receptor alpha [Pangasius sp. VGB-2018]